MLKIFSNLLLAFVFIGIGDGIQAGTINIRTWDGSDNGLWSNAANWVEGAVSPDDILIFPAAANNKSNTNDLAANTDFESIDFEGGGYLIGGSNRIDLRNGFNATNPASTNNIFNVDVLLLQDQTFFVETQGAEFTMNGDVDLGGFSLAFSGAGDFIMNGQITGSGDVSIQGPGAVVLTNNNSYDGGTVVNGGSLIVNSPSSGTGSAAVVVNDAASLEGEGVIGDAIVVNADGMVVPGDQGPGILEVGGANFNAGSILALEINGDTVDSEFAQLRVNGSVQLENPRLQIALGFDPALGTDFLVLNNNGGSPVDGTFNNLPEGETFSLTGIDTIGFTITYQGGDGNDVVLTAIPTLSINDIAVDEGDGNANFTVTLSEASAQTVTVLFDTEDGSAVAGTDYQATQGTLTFNPGVTTQTISVPVFADSADEGTETFFVNLFSPSNATIVLSPGEGTIQDNGGGGGGGCSFHPKESARSRWMETIAVMGILVWILWRRASAQV